MTFSTIFKKIFFILSFISFYINIYGQAASTTSVNSLPSNTVVTTNTTKIKDLLPNNTSTQIEPNSLQIETKYFIINFSSNGGNIVSLKHKDDLFNLKNGVELVNGDNPFRFELYKTPTSLIELNTRNYTLSKNETEKYIDVFAQINLNAITDTDVLLPLSYTKKYRFYKELHYWEYFIEFNNNNKLNLVLDDSYFILSRPIGPVADKNSSAQSEASYYNFYFKDNSLESIAINGSTSPLSCSSSKSDAFIESNINFFGSSSRFMIMVLQPKFVNSGLYNFTEAKEIHVKFKSMSLLPESTTSLDFIAYTGPKEKVFSNITFDLKNQYPFLKDVHEKLYTAFNFGFTAPIRDVIITILDLLYKLVPNYGVAIILFSILFKLIFFPLNQKQASSMKKMSALQPQLKSINEKFKDNPQEKQRRIMTLYKENKINPLSGCLPIVIQIPIFIALYAAFSDSYHLWRSPFITGWIPDLSEPDTVYIIANSIPLAGGFHINILPILMGLTQFIQTKMTVTVGDANQQKIMLFMPLILLFFFWNLPSGVVLYWTVQNILSIIQQMYTNYKK